MLRARALLTLLFVVIYQVCTSQTLIINEVSQGTGAQEYVELLVVGTPTCSDIPCLDLRGYIIDDNNGQFETGSGTGIAQGAVRFSQDDFWSCIPIGTSIIQ